MIGWLSIALAGDVIAGQAPPQPYELTGFVDVGFFDATGDGVGYVRVPRDDRHPDAAWVFRGDPWAPMVNSQGEPADLGLDRTNLDRYDRIASGGNPTFVVNTGYLQVRALPHERVGAVVAVDLQPGTGTLGRLGDVVSVDQAYVRAAPSARSNLEVAAGKILPIFGRQYRARLAPDQHGITPSLMSRYTNGTPLGVRARGSVLDRHLWLAASVANGTNFTERFGHHRDELDSNGGKTASAHVAVATDEAAGVELGVSGMVGSVDQQPDSALVGWQLGADLTVRFGPIEADAEWVQVDQGDRLTARGGHLGVHWLVAPAFAPYARVDWRDAVLRELPNLYDSNVARVTAGSRFDITWNLVVKVEALFVIELDGPPIPDDVFTTSVLVRF